MDSDDLEPVRNPESAETTKAEPLTGFAAGQAAGNIHLAGGDAEVMELGAASKEAQARQERLIAHVEERRRLRATVVPTDVGEVKALLRQLEQPVTLFGEKEMERRDRLRKLCAQLADEDVLAAMDALEPEDGTKQFVPTSVFYTEGSPALVEARLKLAQHSLDAARRRIAVAKRRQGDPDDDPAEEASATEAVVATVVNQTSEVCDSRPVAAAAFAPGGALLATGAWSGKLRLWRVSDAAVQLTVQAHDDRITGVAWHPSAQPSLANGHQDNSATGDDNIKEGGGVCGLATASADTTARLWTSGGKLLHTLQGHTDRLARLAFHPMGDHVGTASFDHTWRLWDVTTGQCLVEQEGHSRPLYAIAFHPDGSLAASAGLDSIGRVWDLRTGRSVVTLEGHVKAVLALDFSPNGYLVASGSEDHSARIWDLRKRTTLYTIPAHTSSVSQVRFEPSDGGYLLTTGFDNTCRLWSGRDWRLLATLAGHEGKVMGGDVSADGSHDIASVGYDKTVKLWAPNDIAVPMAS